MIVGLVYVNAQTTGFTALKMPQSVVTDDQIVVLQ